MTQVTSAALWPERNASQDVALGVLVLVSAGIYEFRLTGAPAASLVSDGVGGYDVSDTNLSGTGKVAVVGGTLGVIY